MKSLGYNIAAAVIAGMPGAGAAAATVEELMITPGLYRIDTETRATHHVTGGKLAVDTDGATGAQRFYGGPSPQVFAGKGPVEHCVGAGTVGAETFKLAAAALKHCPKQNQKVVDGVVVHTAQCPSGTVTTTMRKLSKDVWEYETKHQLYANQGASIDVGPMRSALEMQLKHGSPEQRAKAAEHLAQLPALQASADQARAATVSKLSAAMAKAKTQKERDLLQQAIDRLTLTGGPIGFASVTRQRWTRIADTCSAVKPTMD